MRQVRTLYVLAMCAVGAISLLCVSISDFLVWRRNPEPTEMTLAEYLDSDRSTRWVRLTHCEVEYPLGRCLIHKDRGTMDDRTIPMYPDNDHSRPVRAVLVLGGSVPLDSYSYGAVPLTETIEGVVRNQGLFGSRVNSKVMEGAIWTLADDNIVIDEGAKPNLRLAGLELAAALILGALCLNGVNKILNTGQRRGALVSTLPSGQQPVSAPLPRSAPEYR